MKWLTFARRTRIFASSALLVTTIALTRRALASCQQEVDPTWYDPWPVSNKIAAKPLQPRTASQKPKQKNSSVSARRPGKKARVKRTGNQRQQPWFRNHA